MKHKRGAANCSAALLSYTAPDPDIFRFFERSKFKCSRTFFASVLTVDIQLVLFSVAHPEFQGEYQMRSTF
jgi:hypothetical protein